MQSNTFVQKVWECWGKHFGCEVRLLCKKIRCTKKDYYLTIMGVKKDFCSNLCDAKQNIWLMCWSAKQQFGCKARLLGARKDFCSNISGARQDFCSNILNSKQDFFHKTFWVQTKYFVQRFWVKSNIFLFVFCSFFLV